MMNTHEPNRPTFKYSEILSPNEIRLLQIMPGDHDEPEIHCKLRVVDLHNASAQGFRAVSYVWGSREDRPVILIDGRPFQVTKNCEAVIRHVRDKQKMQVVWIDAICINQENHKEKEDQVARLGTMYKRADSTIIWLGSWSLAGYNSEPEGVCEELSRQAVFEICQQPWFTRSWIVQEFVLSNSPELYVGRRVIPWGALKNAMRDWLKTYEPGVIGHFHRAQTTWQLLTKTRNLPGADNTFDLNYLNNCVVLSELRQIFQKPEIPRPSLLELLVKFRHYRLSKPRDKVYSMLNIAADNDQNGENRIRPNYDNQFSDAECLTVAAIMIIRRQKDLQILRYVKGHAAERIQLGNMPSWVAHWHDDMNYTENGARVSITPGHVETPSSDYPETAPPAVSRNNFSERRGTTAFTKLTKSEVQRLQEELGPNLLRVPSIEVDIIADLGDFMDAEWVDFRECFRMLFKLISEVAKGDLDAVDRARGMFLPFGKIISTLRRWKVFADSGQVPPGGNSTWEAFCATVERDQKQKFPDSLQNRMAPAKLAEKVGGWWKELVESQPLTLVNELATRLGWSVMEPPLQAEELVALNFQQACVRHPLHFQYFAEWFKPSLNYRLARTKKGFLALVPHGAQREDRIVLLPSVKHPFVVRPTADRWQLVGTSWIHNMAADETWQNKQFQEIILE